MSRRDIRFIDAVAVESQRIEPHNGPLSRKPFGTEEERTYPRTLLAARGAIDGKPFAVSLVHDRIYVDVHSLIGHLLTGADEAAVKRAFAKTEKRVVELGAWDPVAEGAVVRELMADAYTYLDVADRALNGKVQARGGLWMAGDCCWAVMRGVDLAPFEEIGVTARREPEWRRAQAAGRLDWKAMSAAGARKMYGHWYVDVAVADHEQLAVTCAELGVTIHESQAESDDWLTGQPQNADLASSGFAEWDWRALQLDQAMLARL